MDESQDHEEEGSHRIDYLNDPEEFGPDCAEVLIVGPALIKKLLRAVAVDIEVPFDAQHSFSVEVFGEPEVEDHKDDHHLIEDETVEKSGEHSSEQKEHNDHSLEGAVHNEAYDRVDQRIGVFLFIDLIPTLNNCFRVGVLGVFHLLRISNF